ncbi:MAG: FAD-dependent monooxygenase [Pseudomonadota bacterium]
MKVAIVGGGPSGLYLAILLKRRRPGWHVGIVEQNHPGSTFGFGVVLADSGLARIRAADAEVYEKLVAKMDFHGIQTIDLREHPIDLHHPAKGGAIARIDMLHVLQEIALGAGVDIQFGQRINHPDELEKFGLGDADVIVGADGVNSVVRAAHEEEFGTTKVFLSNRFAWYGTRRVFEKSALVFRKWKGGYFVAHYYPYSSSMSTFVAECDQATWISFNMEAMSEQARQELFEEIYAPELKGEKLISNNSVWRQFPVIRNRSWTAGNCVVIGDAQTSAHPTIGSGTRIALEDSLALAEALTCEPPAGQPEPTPVQRLLGFAAVRGPAKDKLLDASRKSYLWYEHIGDWMERYTPLEFIYAFMTRTGRMTDQRLSEQYPDLFAQWKSAGVVKGSAAREESGNIA